ncbi:MAG: hypothetical protein ACPL28_06915 [bacterium]
MKKIRRSGEEKIFEKALKYEKILSKKFPDINPHDLHLIILNLIKPKSWPRRFLLRRLKKGGYVP